MNAFPAVLTFCRLSWPATGALPIATPARRPKGYGSADPVQRSRHLSAAPRRRRRCARHGRRTGTGCQMCAALRAGSGLAGHIVCALLPRAAVRCHRGGLLGRRSEAILRTAPFILRFGVVQVYLLYFFLPLHTCSS